MTTYEFADAAPVKVSSKGRPAKPNPFTDVIKTIALKTVKTDGVDQPVAKSFVQKHEGTEEARKKVLAKVKSQLSRAGEKNDPPVTVFSTATPVKTGPKGREKDSDTDTQVTFWTVPRMFKPRKAKTSETATASTPQSTAVTSA